MTAPRGQGAAPLLRLYGGTPTGATVVGAGRALVPVLVLAAWVVAARASELVPTLPTTLTALWGAFAEGWVVEPLWDTMKAVLGGFAVGLGFALPLGYAIGRMRNLAAVLNPLLTAGFAVPRVILYPVLLAFLGVGVESKLAMAAISAFFPIVLTTAAAVKDVDPLLVKVGRSLRCNEFVLATKVMFPASLPTLMVGARIGLSVAFITTIIAELFAAVDGLGVVIKQAYALLQLPRMFAVVVLITVIAVCANLLLWTVERKLRSAVE